MSTNRLDYLFQRYLSRSITIEENQELMQLLRQPANDAAVKALLDGVWNNLSIDNRLSGSKADALFSAILASDRAMQAPLPQRPVRRLFRLSRIAAAAAVLLLVGTGIYYFYTRKPAPAVVQTDGPAHYTNDIPPGINNAVLLLADGRRILLDSSANGELARQENTTITKKDGQVQYDASNSPLTTDHSPMNTITTARGNQYQLILPDGSKVWLNAASSVRFPVAFTGNERRVEVTGEVFFDVVHNSKMPFTVLANGVEVHDLGTQFNINAYNNEDGVKTTVVEGKVKVVHGESSMVNGPGEQAMVDSKGAIKRVKDADVEAAIAWKNGQFMFAGSPIQSVMRQLERWYDIEVTFAPGVSKEEYIGTITRFSNISAVLKMLERTGTVRFEVNGRRVIVK
jgi:ferric-dicitrate binding protein FerR (iron transport regulator)